MDESKLPDELLAKLSQDLFGDGGSAFADEFEEIERKEAARPRKRIVIGSVVGLLGAIGVIAIVWWLVV